jgi:hypothetical protein
VLPDTTSAGGVDYRQRAYAAQRHGKVPDGHRLHVARTSAGFEIKLLAGETGNELGADPIHVPARVTRYHRVVASFRERTALHEISRQALPRVMRIMHALVKELETRGHEVDCVAVGRTDPYGRNGWAAKDDGQFRVRINGHDLRLRIYEKGVGLRGPWEARKARRQEDRDNFRFDRWDHGRIEAYDKDATGQLELSILGHAPRQNSWGDRKRWTLEGRLPQALRELETLAADAEDRRLQREREEQERQRAWEQAMHDAKRRFIDAHRLDVLRRRVAAWNEAEEIRAYCDAVEARFAKDAVAEHPGAEEWLRLAREQAGRLQALPGTPPDPEPTAEQLKPYLGRWSPYGPQGY